MMEHAVLALAGVKIPWREKKKNKKNDQGIGEYCGGSDIDECSKLFGDVLWQVCRTCPD